MRSFQFNTLAAVTAAIFITGCDGIDSNFITPKLSDNVQKNSLTQVNPEGLKSIRYFKGGWYGLAPNWSHDFTVTFNIDGSAQVAAEVADEYCGKSGGLNMGEARTLVNTLIGLELETSTGFASVDQGHETVELEYTDGSSQIIYLAHDEAPKGFPVAVNGSELSTLLQAIDDSLAMWCQ